MFLFPDLLNLSVHMNFLIIHTFCTSIIESRDTQNHLDYLIRWSVAYDLGIIANRWKNIQRKGGWQFTSMKYTLDLQIRTNILHRALLLSYYVLPGVDLRSMAFPHPVLNDNGKHVQVIRLLWVRPKMSWQRSNKKAV